MNKDSELKMFLNLREDEDLKSLEICGSLKAVEKASKKDEALLQNIEPAEGVDAEENGKNKHKCKTEKAIISMEQNVPDEKTPEEQDIRSSSEKKMGKKKKLRLRDWFYED